MGTKVACNGWPRFSLMRSKKSRAGQTGLKCHTAFSLDLGQWLRAWLPQRWRGENIEPSPRPNHSAMRRWQKQIRPAYLLQYTMLLLLVMSLLVNPSTAAFIYFENCLAPSVINSNPLQLQFVPLHVYAAFNTTAASRNLNVTVYGNVSGLATPGPYPAPNDPQWTNPNETVGKIVDVSEPDNLASTLFASFNVLSYTPYNLGATRFANTTIQGQFPLAPVFTANA